MAPSLVYGLVLLVAACWFGPSLAFHSRVSRSNSSFLKSTSAPIDGSAAMIKSILKKPSKVLTVGLEYIGNNLSNTEINTLSMQLRKCKVTAIWCSDVDNMKEFVREQETARGNFPGPCPVIYYGDVKATAAAAEAGASAVVLSAEDVEKDQFELSGNCEIIWKISSIEEMRLVLEKSDNSADAFLLDGSNKMEEVAAALPSGAMYIASVDPMQQDGAEIERAKELKKLGCASILIRQACVGDSEDLEYAQFLVGGMTSKASSEFKFSGLTGSTNGHFGGVQATGSVKWRRVEN